ncbi:MAG: DUF2490 domain-containing protein [Coraliomargaritaceae bacterium]
MFAFLRLLLTTLVLVFPLTAQAGYDWGNSHNLLVKASLSEDWFLISRSNMASRNDFNDYFLGYTGLGLGYQHNEKWSFRSGYRQAWFKIAEEWKPEYRPYIESYYASFYDGFRLTSRTRFEFRFYDHRDDYIRGRQEFTLTAPWKFTPLKLQPYLEEEVFYNFEKEWIEANWLGGGLSFRPWDGAKFKLGYRLNKYRIGKDFRTRNVIVTGLNLFF